MSSLAGLAARARGALLCRMGCMGRMGRQRGFTLLELMVTLAVLAVLSVVAAPGMASFVASNRAVTIQTALSTSLSLARSEAVRSGLNVIVQAAAGGSSGNELGGGWDLYSDRDASGTVTPQDRLLRHFEALPPGLKVQGPTRATFAPTGFLSPLIAEVWRVCRTDGNRAGWSITLTPSGGQFVAPVTNCS